MVLGKAYSNKFSSRPCRLLRGSNIPKSQIKSHVLILGLINIPTFFFLNHRFYWISAIIKHEIQIGTHSLRREYIPNSTSIAHQMVQSRENSKPGYPIGNKQAIYIYIYIDNCYWYTPKHSLNTSQHFILFTRLQKAHILGA